MRRTRFAMMAVVMMVVALILVPAAPASAHHALESSTPAAGERLDIPPSQVVLTFAVEVREADAVIELVDETGAPVPTSNLVVEGRRVAVDVDLVMSEGHYQVRWSAISFDEGSLHGVVPFAVGEPAAVVDPFQRVITPAAASRIRLGAYLVFGGLLAAVLIGLVTTYGGKRTSRRRRRPVR